MASLQDIADGLAVRLRTVAGLRAYAWEPDQIAPPCAVVEFPLRIEYEQTMGLGKTRWTLPVSLYASRVDAERGQAALAPYFDDRDGQSIRGAIYADDTLGGAADCCLLLLADRFGVKEIGGVAYWGCQLTVEVWTS